MQGKVIVSPSVVISGMGFWGLRTVLQYSDLPQGCKVIQTPK